MSHKAAATITSLPVSAEARGRVRELAASIGGNTSRRMATALARLPPRTLAPWTWKGLRGRERAIDRLRRALPLEPEAYTPLKAGWRWIEAVAELPTDDCPSRPGFVVMAVLAVSKWRQVRVETFGACYTHHAICRLLDRSAFKIDPVVTMLAAHDAICRLDDADGTRVLDLARHQLPTATGAFFGTAGRFGEENAPLFVCRTWVPADQLHADQVKIAAAWNTLTGHSAGAA